MPSIRVEGIIRYDTGDIATIGEMRDNVLYSIDLLVGRKTDLIYKTNGEPVDFANGIPPVINNNLDVLQSNGSLFNMQLNLTP